MSNQHLLYCATDKEIFDVIMASRQRLTEAVLFELGRDRGIFYSPTSTRNFLAESLSLLPHDYHDITLLLNHREHAGRSEKVTSVTFPVGFTIEEIKSASQAIMTEATDERVVANQESSSKYNINVEYSEIDYSKNRLVQRRKKEADIEIIVSGESTTVRMPANAKGREIAAALKVKLEIARKISIDEQKIELDAYKDPAMRTLFFTRLISKLEGFKLENVPNVRVETFDNEADDLDETDDDGEKQIAKQEMLAVVNHVAMKGQSLLSSAEYQQLREKGFFITYIVWRSKMDHPPHTIYEFEAGFEEAKAGRGFKYAVRGAKYFDGGTYTKTLRPVPDDQKQELLSSIEAAAKHSMLFLSQKPAGTETDA